MTAPCGELATETAASSLRPSPDSDGDRVAGEKKKFPQWTNALYRRQPYADNYVPSSFLEKLVTNAYVREPNLRSYVVSTFVVTQQISAVTLFLAVFLRIQDGLISVGTMVLVDFLVLFGGYATLFIVSPKRERLSTGSPAADNDNKERKGVDGVPQRLEDEGPLGALEGATGDENAEGLSLSSVSSTLHSFFLFLAILRIMAPVLRTLTVSYSDDTIYALAVMLSFVHLAFHDYSYINTASGHFQGTLSLNAGMFAAVLLASRLESNEQVFAVILFALELFAFFPLARREVKRHSLLLHGSVTSAVMLPTGLLLLLRHPTLFASYVSIVVLVTVVCPLWLLKVQRYKLRIEGPWDIAHVETSP